MSETSQSEKSNGEISNELEPGGHVLEDTVIAVFDQKAQADKAVSELTASGYKCETLFGEEGRKHLRPEKKGGLFGALKSMATSLGDETRLIANFEEALAEGKVVVSAETAEKDAKQAVKVLDDHGGKYVWEFDQWTHTRVATDDGEDHDSKG